MKTISKFFLLTLVLLLVSLATISATENNTQDTQNIQTDQTQTNSMQTTANKIQETTTNNEETNLEKTIEKNQDIEKGNQTQKSAASTITVTSSNYKNFFNTEEGQGLHSTDLIQAGDTVNLKGTFENMDIMVDKNITLTSINKDAQLINSTVYVIGNNASGSTIKNLNIYNNGTLIKGIQVKNASKLLVEDNTIETYGLRSYGFVADYMKYSTIRNNYFTRAGDDWRYITFVIGKSSYNTIANNTLLTGGANGIYLSIYGSLEANFDGGPSDYNNITGNNITSTGYITSWCYNIQIMGANNIVSYNTVKGGFRGISTQDYENNIVRNNDVQAINEGITACEGSLITENNVHVNESSRGISIGGENARVINNNISSIDGPGIEISTGNVYILNNSITSTNGYGIYSKGQYTNINIENNKIHAHDYGIYFKKQSNTRKINDIYLKGNNIVSESDYAINFEEAGAGSTDQVNITVTSDNVLKSALGIGSVAYLPPANYVSVIELDTDQVINVTQDNYDEWFDEGIANIKVKQNATVYLKGTFTNCSFTFTKKVHVIGVNCQINEGTITLTSDSHESTVTGINIKNSNSVVTSHGIEIIEVNNCKITNTNITAYSESETLGIFLFGANGNTVQNCKITASGDYINNGILTYSSDSNILENNVINLKLSDIQIPYDDSVMFNEKIGTIQEILHNHGIVLIYSSENIVNGNKITVTSKFTNYTFPTNDCKNSVVGIDVYFDCHNNRITNNNISITNQGPFSYGMGVLGGYWGSSISSLNATNNIYISNNVKVNGGYFATGFIAGRNSDKTIVSQNNITLTAVDYSHGITLENSTTTNISNNNINTTASSVYSIELFDSSNNEIRYNTITTRATLPLSIAGSRSSYNNIIDNVFKIEKVNLGTSTSASHADSIEATDKGISFTLSSKQNNITRNTITSNATIAVYLSSQTRNNTVFNNSIKSKSKSGDNAVLNEHSSNNVSNNFVYFVDVSVNPVDAMIGTTINFVANVSSTTNSTSNLKATFSLGSNVIGTSTVSNGKANVSYRVSTLWRPAVYQITVNLQGTDFQNATGSAKANLKVGLTEVVVKVPKVLQVLGTKKSIVVNITDTMGGKVGSGQAQFYLDKKLIGTSNVTLGKASIDYTVSKSAVAKKHNLTVVYLGSTKYAECEASNAWYFQNQTVITVSNRNVTLGGILNVRATVKSGSNPIASGNVSVRINGNHKFYAKIVNGVVNANYTIPTTYVKGDYVLRVVYAGTNLYSSASKPANLTMKAMTPVFHYNTTKAKVGSKVSLALAIDNGKNGSNYCAANAGKVYIRLNGVLLRDANNNVIYGNVSKGKIVFTFTAPTQLVGYQNLTFVFKGNKRFNALTKTYTKGLQITKNQTVITVQSRTVTLGGILNVRATVKSGSNPIKSGNVSVRINGNHKFYAKIVNGVVNVNYTVPTSYVKGNYILRIVYAGGDTSYSASKAANLTMKAMTPMFHYNVTKAKVGSKVSVVLAIDNGKTGSNYCAANAGKVYIRLNGALIQDSNNTIISKNISKGKVKFTFTLPRGLEGYQNLTFVFKGNKRFNALTKTYTKALLISKQ